LVALTLLAISLLGLATLFPLAIRLGAESQVASETLRVAQREFDQIRQHAFTPSGSFVDLDGNLVDVYCTGAPGTSCGNPLTAGGKIDYSLPAPVGFSAELADSSGRLYSIRWNISVTLNDGRKIVLAGMPLNPPGGLARTVQLETLVAR